jgi:hypothetical protein
VLGVVGEESDQGVADLHCRQPLVGQLGQPAGAPGTEQSLFAFGEEGPMPASGGLRRDTQLAHHVDLTLPRANMSAAAIRRSLRAEKSRRARARVRVPDRRLPADPATR